MAHFSDPSIHGARRISATAAVHCEDSAPFTVLTLTITGRTVFGDTPLELEIFMPGNASQQAYARALADAINGVIAPPNAEADTEAA